MFQHSVHSSPAFLLLVHINGFVTGGAGCEHEQHTYVMGAVSTLRRLRDDF